MALRLGNVQAKTIDEVLRLAAERCDRTIQGVHPKRHVLCAFGNVGSSVQPRKAAGNHQLTRTMAQATPKAGFLAKVRAMICVTALHEMLQIFEVQSKDTPAKLSRLRSDIPSNRI